MREGGGTCEHACSAASGGRTNVPKVACFIMCHWHIAALGACFTQQATPPLGSMSRQAFSWRLPHSPAQQCSALPRSQPCCSRAPVRAGPAPYPNPGGVGAVCCFCRCRRPCRSLHDGWLTGCTACAPRLTAAASRLGTLRYDSEEAASPMHTASSASCCKCMHERSDARRAVGQGRRQVKGGGGVVEGGWGVGRSRCRVVVVG